MGPLSGVRVIDITSVVMGPFATQMLAEYGAEVIKIEPPDGDLLRYIGPMRNEAMGPLFLNANKGKKSVAIDLKSDKGRALLFRLLKDADVLVYNVRPAAMKRLGLDYDTVAAANPRLVYAGVYGFGEGGPYAGKPAYDDLIQGASGLAHLMARSGDGVPRYAPNALADRVVGLVAVGAILASLVARDKSGHGQRLDLPMYETMAAFVLGDHMGGLTFEPALDEGGYARQLSRYRKPYKTRDSFVCALMYNDKHWLKFFEAANRPDLKDDKRFSSYSERAIHVDEIYQILGEIFLERTTDEWMSILDEADIPAMPMHDLRSILTDPHLTAVGTFDRIDHPTEGSIITMRSGPTWSDTQPEVPTPAPCIGNDTIAVLRAHGIPPEEIDTLLSEGVVRAAERTSE